MSCGIFIALACRLFFLVLSSHSLSHSHRVSLSLSLLTTRHQVALTFDSEEETRVHLLVHDLQPPFLDGRVVFTKQVCALAIARVFFVLSDGRPTW